MLSAAAAQVWIVPAELLNALNGFFLAYVAAVARWGARLPGAVAEVGIAGRCGWRSPTRRWPASLGAAWRLRGAARRRAAPLGACALVAVAAAALLLRGHAPAPPARLHRHVPRRRPGRRDPGPGAGRLAALVDGGPPEADVASKLRARGVDAPRRGGAHPCPGGPPGRPRGRADRGLPGRRPARRRPLRRRARPPAHRGARPRPGGARHPRRGRAALQARACAAARRAGSRGRRSTPRTASTRTCAPRCCTLSYRGLDVLLPADAESEVTAALAAAAESRC